jgi:hypothetical protein
MNPRSSSSALALLGVVLAACSSSPPYAARRIEDAPELGNVHVMEASLADIVLVGPANVDRVPGTNQMQVMLPIRNGSDTPIQILVQVSFLDGRRRMLGDDTNQQVKVINPWSTMPVVVTSKQDLAQDWQMTISWNQ